LSCGIINGLTPGARTRSSGTGHPNLNLTPEEKRAFYQLFQAADKTNLGVVTGEVAVSFFEKTHLPAETLGLVRVDTVAFSESTRIVDDIIHWASYHGKRMLTAAIDGIFRYGNSRIHRIAAS
jgi:hypothetical protein